MPGLVHVSGYQQRRHGLLVDVADYERGAPVGGGEKLSPEQAYRGYLDAIKEAEGSKGKPHGGARERNPKTNALGQYQMLLDAFRSIGWKDADGTWTQIAREQGIDSDEAFLENPDAQEAAMRAYTDRNHKILIKNRSMNFVGRRFVSPNGKSFVVSEAGVAAAAHRAGAPRTGKVLEKLASKAAGNSPSFDPKEKAAITRMRLFEKVPYAVPKL